MKQALVDLREYVAQGYVLHGARRRLSIVEPRQAHDTDTSRTTGNQLAVYAEAEDIRIPIVKAMLSEKDRSPDYTNWSAGYSVTGGRMCVTGRNACFRPGYVHVLPRTNFDWIQGPTDRELISRVAVMPFEVVWVEPEIILLLDIEVEFT